MKILLYSSKFPPQIGGVENVLKYLSINFTKNHKVFVITTLNLSDIAPRLLSKLIKGFVVKKTLPRYQSVNVTSFFMSIPRSIFGYLALVYRFPVSVTLQRFYINKIKPQVINAHFLDDSLYYFYFATLGLSIPIYLDIHGNELHMFSKSKPYKYFMQRIINKSKIIIVHSKYMQKELARFYNIDSDKVSIIPNGVDLQKFNSKNFKNKPSLDYYLFVGRFDKKKGLDILLKAYKKIEKETAKKLVIVGGGRGEEKHGKLSLGDLSEKYKSDKIIFTGLISNEEVQNYYYNAFYSVFPSLHEPFGIVALESMAFGTPFVASSGGFEEIISKTEAGVSFKAGSVKQLSKLLLSLDKNKSKRLQLSINCISQIKKYSWVTISNNYLELFKN